MKKYLFPSYISDVRYHTDGVNPLKKMIGTSEYNWGIEPPTSNMAAAAATDGSGQMVVGGYKLFCVFYSSRFGVKSNPFSMTPVEVTLAGGQNAINLTGIPVSPDPQINIVQIARTAVDEAAPYYIVGEVDNGTTVLTLLGGDDSLSIGSVLEPPAMQIRDSDPSSLVPPWRYTAPPLKRFSAAWDSKVFLAGEYPHRQGLATATNNSPTITGVGTTVWSADHIGKRLRFLPENTWYFVANVVGQTITLEVNYVRPTGVATDPTSAVYEILGNVNEVLWSETSAADHVPPINQLLIGEDTGEGISGLIDFRDQLRVFLTTSIYSLVRTGNPALPYRVPKTGSDVGCAAPRSIVATSSTLFFFGQDGFHGFDGNNSFPIGLELGDIPVRLYQKEDIIGASSMTDRRIYWAVATEPGLPWLDTILVYDMDAQYWDLPITGLRIWDMVASYSADDKREIIFLSLDARSGVNSLVKFDPSMYSDIADTGTTESTVTGAGEATLTDDTATFDVDGIGLVGARVTIYAGTGAGQVRFIREVVGTTLKLDEPWDTGFIPDSTSQYAIGLIVSDLLSRTYTVSDPHVQKAWKHLEMKLQTSA